MLEDLGKLLTGGRGSGAEGVLSGTGDLLRFGGDINQAFEYKRQANVQQQQLEQSSRSLLAFKASATRDIETRARIMSGQIVGGAGKRGVTTDSASIINAAAEVMGKAEVDKLRLAVNVQNQIIQNEQNQAELKLRGSKSVSDSITQAFIGVGAKAVGYGLSLKG